MRLKELNMIQFRNYDDSSFEPDEKLNIFIGKNAQGKTTILEAVYMLATSRSWKANRDIELIKWNTDNAKVSSSVIREISNDVDISVEIFRGDKKNVFVNTIKQTKLAGLMGQVNVVLIEPHDVEIIRSDPSKRRRFIDMEISQIQPQYCNLLAGYKKILEHRNKLLKDIQSGNASISTMEVWTDQLVIYGSQIIERRLAFLKDLSDKAKLIHLKITDNSERLGIEYCSSLKLEDIMTADGISSVMNEYLHRVRSDEIRRGTTLAGPQRDDILFSLNGIDSRIYGSQGQQRTISLSLRLAEIDIMREASGEMPIVLLDDVMTDLDDERRANVFEMTGSRCQTYITAANTRLLNDDFISGGTVFIVDGGRITKQ